MTSIQRPTLELERAIEDRKEGFSTDGIHVHELNSLCLDVMNAIDTAAIAPETAKAIPAFWKSFDKMCSYSYISALETRTVKVRVMSLARQIHNWIGTVISDATSRNWARQLMKDIEAVIDTKSSRPLHFDLDASTYIPGLSTATPYTGKVPRFTYDNASRHAGVVAAASAAIRQWLGFPMNTEEAIVQTSLLTSLAEADRTDTLLYLDEVWDLFANTSMRLRYGWRPSKQHLELTLTTFGSMLNAHPLFQPGSPERVALTHLTSLIHSWQNNRATSVIPVLRPHPPTLASTSAPGVNGSGTSSPHQVCCSYANVIIPN